MFNKTLNSIWEIECLSESRSCRRLSSPRAMRLSKRILTPSYLNFHYLNLISQPLSTFHCPVDPTSSHPALTRRLSSQPSPPPLPPSSPSLKQSQNNKIIPSQSTSDESAKFPPGSALPELTWDPTEAAYVRALFAGSLTHSSFSTVDDLLRWKQAETSLVGTSLSGAILHFVRFFTFNFLPPLFISSLHVSSHPTLLISPPLQVQVSAWLRWRCGVDLTWASHPSSTHF